jgi:hypothetical protein
VCDFFSLDQIGLWRRLRGVIWSVRRRKVASLQLITLTIASFVGISVGVVPALTLGGVATLICAFC